MNLSPVLFTSRFAILPILCGSLRFACQSKHHGLLSSVSWLSLLSLLLCLVDLPCSFLTDFPCFLSPVTVYVAMLVNDVAIVISGC